MNNLQDEENSNNLYNMIAHRSEKGQANNNLENYDYVLTFAQYHPYGPEFFIFGGL